MAYFRFVIRDGSDIPQPEPIELDSVQAAKSHAVMLLGQMLKDIDGKFWLDSHWTIEVTDMNGMLLARIDVDGSSSPAAP